jgi:hypothetical protein
MPTEVGNLNLTYGKAMEASFYGKENGDESQRRMWGGMP